jgi:hypothetical protein
MTGWAYLQDSNKEVEAVNSFLMRLKENKQFSGIFKDISITSVNQSQVKNAAATNFIIVCKGAR